MQLLKSNGIFFCAKGGGAIEKFNMKLIYKMKEFSMKLILKGTSSGREKEAEIGCICIGEKYFYRRNPKESK